MRLAEGFWVDTAHGYDEGFEPFWHIVLTNPTDGPFTTACGQYVPRYDGAVMQWDEGPNGPNSANQSSMCALCLEQLPVAHAMSLMIR